MKDKNGKMVKSLIVRPHKAEAQVAAPVRRAVVVTIRRSAAPGIEDPATTTVDPVRAIIIPGAAIIRRALVAVMVPIFTPLPDIATHVI